MKKNTDSIYEVVVHETVRKVFRVSLGPGDDPEELDFGNMEADVEEEQGDFEVVEVEVFCDAEDF